MHYILKNILPKDYSNNAVITLFHINFKDAGYNPANERYEIEKEFENWPHANIRLEIICNRRHNSNHDRFIVTDGVRFNSSTSFDFLTYNKCTTIDRFAIYNCPEFGVNLDQLTNFLKHCNSVELKKSRNSIIKSFLQELS